MTLKVRGHVGFSHKGEDILCSALSSLLRSGVDALLVLPKEEINLKVIAPKEGFLEWNLSSWNDSFEDLLQGISLVIICGLQKLSLDNPDFFDLEIKSI